MRLYHGSTISVPNPKIVNTGSLLDFGAGFYTTPSKEQAEDFARKVFRRRCKQEPQAIPTVSVYDYDEGLGQKKLRLLSFDAPDARWLSFIVENRRHGRLSQDSDIISGPVANDDVFRTIALFMSGDIDEKDAIKRFRIKELYHQMLFCTEQALALLEYDSSYEVEVPQ